MLRRLQDAQAQQLAHGLDSYVSPGVLWWAFDQEGARAQVHRSRTRAGSAFEPGEYLQGENAVVLLDEIDKADPDVPNNLLVPLGALSFRVEETGEEVRAHVPPLVFLTTNDERDLPPAFVRRCVELKIKSPSSDQLIEVGTAHFTDVSENLLKSVAEIFASSNEFSTNVPSTAEYLDTVQACIHLGIEPGSELFKTLSRVTVWKHGRVAPTNEGL